MTTRNELLADIGAERERLTALLGRMPSRAFVVVPAGFSHSPKDVIAHLAAYEDWVALRLDAAGRGFTPSLDVDRVGFEAQNERLWDDVSGLTPVEALERSRRSHEALTAAVGRLPEGDLDAPTALDDAFDQRWIGGHTLASAIASDTYEHCREHYPLLEAALAADTRAATRDRRSADRERRLRPRALLAAWRDPVRRPRVVIGAGLALVAVIVFTAASLTLTSTRWFCNNACHGVHADNARQYAAGSHANISCLACHIPVGLDPARFAVDKADKLVDLYGTVFHTYEFPLNHGSYIAMSTPVEQCTQCHDLKTRGVSASPGLRIEHEPHERREIYCTACHNRVAHPEDQPMVLEGNVPHEDFMSMRACFRCHRQAGDADLVAGEAAPAPARRFEATGDCSACHTPGFRLKPASHDEPGFYTPRGRSGGHARLARADATETAEARTEWIVQGPELVAKKPRPLMRLLPAERFLDVAPPSTVSECGMCHRRSFCDGCHGLQVPHPAGFEKGHGSLGKTRPQVCAKCHNTSGDARNDAGFCDQCHHSSADPARPWFGQHPEAVKRSGSGECVRCHESTWCSRCHVSGQRRR